MAVMGVGFIGNPRELPASILVKDLTAETLFYDFPAFARKRLRRGNDSSRTEPRHPMLFKMVRQHVERLGVPVNQDRRKRQQTLHPVRYLLLGEFIRRDEESAHQPRIKVLADNLTSRHSDRLVPEPRLAVAEAPASPLHPADRGSPAHLELKAIGKAYEGFSG